MVVVDWHYSSMTRRSSEEEQQDIAAFVLAGGRSSRMGSDKALLEWRGEPLVARQARLLEAALPAGSNVAIVGSIARYGAFGFPVVEDLRQQQQEEEVGETHHQQHQGPLAGIEAALASPYAAEWNLVIACDMPRLDAGLLARLLGTIAQQAGPDTDVILSRSASHGPEPLCSIYRRRFVRIASRQLDAGRRKVREALEEKHGVELVHFEIDDESVLTNLNTPADWRRAAAAAEAAAQANL